MLISNRVSKTKITKQKNMNKISHSLGVIVFVLFHILANAQQIKKAEYFYDTDPGVGNATAITLTQADSVDITTSLPTTGLAEGIHQLSIRTKNTTGLWSLYETRNFCISSASSSPSLKIIKAEYFFDTDPGVGNGTFINTGVISDSINTTTSIATTGLTEGVHTLFIRTYNELNMWSMYEGRSFYIESTPSTVSSKIKKAEYFIDIDPGVGNGTAINTSTWADSVDITTSIPTNNLSAGIHTLFIRTYNENNMWSMYEGRTFNVEAPNISTVLPKILAAEYFFDEDPGVGNGISINTGALADSININQSIPAVGLTSGAHALFIRTKNESGLWSMYEGKSFTICSSVPSVNLGNDGGACAGSVNLNAGNAGATYLWNTGETTQSISVANSGTYWVQVSTALGCSAIDSINIFIGQPTANIYTNTLSACVGDSILLNASTETGMQYQWKKNGVNIAGATSTFYYAKTAGSYTLLVTSPGNCSTLSPITSLTFNSLPSASIVNGNSAIICTGGTINLTASSGSGYNYQWRENGINITGANSQTYTTSFAGQYSVVITANGCSAQSGATAVTVNPLPTATITPQGPTNFCNGGSVALLANTGAGLTYQWQKNGVNLTATAAGYNANSSGSFTVIITDANGCSNTSAAEVITVNPTVIPSLTVSASQTTICNGDFVTFNINAINGGTTPSYVWKKNNVVISGQTTSSYTSNSINNGDQFTVVMTSNANCASPATATAPLVTINVSSAVQAIVSISSNDTSLCIGQSLLMLANNIQGGGTAPTYQWYKNGSIIAGANSATYSTSTSLSNDSYSVEMTSNSSCAIGSPALSLPQYVSVTNNVTPSISISNNTGTACAGAPISFTANASNGGIYPYFVWRVNGSNVSSDFNPNFTTTNLQNNDIVSAVMISSIECVTSMLANSNNLNASVTQTNYNLNFSANTTNLSSQPFLVAFSNASAAAPTVKYTWYFGDGTNASNIAPLHVYPANGVYSVTLFAQDTINSCIDTLRKVNYITCNGGAGSSSCTHTVSINPNTSLNLCVGSTKTLLATTTAVNPNFQWNINGVPIGGATQNSYLASINGFYSVTVYENGGCPVTSNAISITFNNAAPAAPVITQTGALNGCNGGSITLSAGNGFSSYLWNTGATTPNITVSNSGVYSVTGTNAAGCNVQSTPILLNNTYLQSPQFCYVTVDTLNNKNVLVWDKSIYNPAEVDSFVIYKEGIYTGVFYRLGAQSFSALSEFTDATSTPNTKAARYKIAVVDTCGNVSLQSSIFKTMHLQITPGIGNERNLSWTHFEGLPYAYYYLINRKYQNTWTVIDSIQSSLNTYTDMTPPNINVRYAVTVRLAQPCTSSKDIQTAHIKSTSNSGGNFVMAIIDPQFVGYTNYAKGNTFSVYPNPAMDFLHIEIDAEAFNIISKQTNQMRLFDLLGNEVMSEIISSKHTEMNIKALTSGIYVIKFGNYIQRFIKE